MISPTSTYAGTGRDRVAASACLASTAPSGHALGGQLCPQLEQRFGGSPITPITAVRRRQGVGDLSTMKINKFDFPYNQGSTVWRPPV